MGVGTHTVGKCPRLRAGDPMGLGVAIPFCHTCARFRIPLARCRQVYGKLTGLGDACLVLGRCLPSPMQGYAYTEGTPNDRPCYP